MLKETAIKRNQLIDSLNELNAHTQFAISAGRGDAKRALLFLNEMPYDPDIEVAKNTLNEIIECDKLIQPEQKAIHEGLDVLDEGIKIMILMCRGDLKATYKMLVGAEKANLEGLADGTFDDDALEIAQIMKVDLPKAIALLERAAVIDCVDLE